MKSCSPSSIVAALSLVALFANAATVEDEIKALKATIASNSVNRTTKCVYYTAWFADLCTKEEHNAILDRNIAAHRRWIELEPDNPTPYAWLGRTLATVGRWDEAKKELEKAMSAKGKWAPHAKAYAIWELANCRWREGDREGVKKLLPEFIPAAKNWPAELGGMTKRVKYLMEMLDDPEADMDMLKLPHHVDGKPFPTPQEATYGDTKVSLAKVELNGLSRGDPMARLLKKKLTRFGSKFEKGGTPVQIEISPDAPVDKSQGYSLDVASGLVSIKARDRLGATWGVVSFIQCIDRGKLTICECSIRDWPRCLRRGASPYWDPELLEYTLFNKMSMMDIGIGGEWTISPLDRERHRLTALHFREFGIETRFHIRSIAMLPMLPLSSPRVRKLHLAMARFYASLGVGAALDLDDHRFPMHPLDLEKAGTAANLDAKYITGIYREIKKDYPEFSMMFCPPFYWGPDGGVNYPEPRDAYLKSLATDLDPEIDVIWTGPRVKTSNIQTNKAAWITKLIGKKPCVVSNGDSVGLHSYVCYGADPAGYKKSHCPEIFDLVASFQQNMSAFSCSTWTGSCADWCWNPDAHDPKVAVKRAIDQLEGPGVSELLAAATVDLTYLDKYPYGYPRIEVFMEDQANLDRIASLAEKTWKDVLALAKNEGRFVHGFYHFGVKGARRIAEAKRNPSEKMLRDRESIMANTKFAVSEAGYDAARGDVFIPSEMMRGGFYNPAAEDWSKKGPRGVKYVPVGAVLEMSFGCDDFPPERAPRLVVVGEAWSAKAFPEVEIEVNGRVVWRGVAFNVPYYFKPLEVEIPVDALQRSNRLVIRNASPESESNRKPLIHFVVIKR